MESKVIHKFSTNSIIHIEKRRKNTVRKKKTKSTDFPPHYPYSLVIQLHKTIIDQVASTPVRITFTRFNNIWSQSISTVSNEDFALRVNNCKNGTVPTKHSFNFWWHCRNGENVSYQCRENRESAFIDNPIGAWFDSGWFARGICVGMQFVKYMFQWYMLLKLPFLKCRYVFCSCGRKCGWYGTRWRQMVDFITISSKCSLKLCLRCFDPILMCCSTTFKVCVLHTRVEHSCNDV